MIPAAAFIFDLDGTLIDSRRDIAAAANAVQAWRGAPALTEEEVAGYVGDGARELVRRLLARAGTAAGEAEVAAGLAVFRRHYGRHLLDHTRPFPGVLETLEHFRSLPLAVATNKPRAFTRAILAGLGLEAYFRRVVSPEDAGRRKPDPTPLRICLEGLDPPPGAVVVVGDSPHDIAAARAIGAAAVAAAYGLTEPARLRAAAPDLIIQRCDELIARCRILPGGALPGGCGEESR